MWVLLLSIKSLRDAYTGTLWPEQFDFTHYAYVFQSMPQVLRNFANSIIVTLATVVITTVIAVLAGYALVHLRTPGPRPHPHLARRHALLPDPPRLADRHLPDPELRSV